MSGMTKDEILGADDLQKQFVDVPEWGGGVWVRNLMGNKRDAFEALVLARKTGEALMAGGLRAQFCAWTICDEDGGLLFSEDDVEKLGQKSGVALDRVFTVAHELNQMAPDDIEELGKDSEHDQSDDSGSD